VELTEPTAGSRADAMLTINAINKDVSNLGGIWSPKKNPSRSTEMPNKRNSQSVVQPVPSCGKAIVCDNKAIGIATRNVTSDNLKNKAHGAPREPQSKGSPAERNPTRLM
jgi:hypothetical protein